MDRSIVKQLEKEKNSNFIGENFVVMFIYWGTIKRYMDRDWTASFSIRFRNGTCIIILDKKYNITNSSCHFGSYGSIWTGPSPKKYGPVRHQTNSICHILPYDPQCYELFAIYLSYTVTDRHMTLLVPDSCRATKSKRQQNKHRRDWGHHWKRLRTTLAPALLDNLAAVLGLFVISW
jgi:hypothetical protein